MQSKTFFKVLGLVLVAASLRAETSITETAFLASIGSDHPSAVALRKPLGRAAADRAEAAVLGNPSLRFDREQPEDEPRETVWSVGWTAPLDGRYGLGVDVAEEEIKATEHRLGRDLMTLRLERRRVFADWLMADRRLSLLTRHSERLQELAQRMMRRAEVGEESELDARRFELAATVVASELAVAEVTLMQARTVAFLWNPDLPADSEPVLLSLPEIPSGLEPWDRPDLQAKQAELEKSRLEARLSRRFWSFPELYVGWKTIRDPDLDSEQDGPVFGFDWQVPIFDRRQADKRQVEIELTSAQAEWDWSSEMARAELEVALKTYETLLAAAKQARTVAIGSDEVLRLGGRAFALGESSTTDLLEIWGSVVTTQLAALDLEVETLAAHREIEAATGLELPLGESP